MQDIKVKRNQQTPKDVKFNALQNGHLGFPKLLGFVPQKSKFRFFKNKCPKIPKFYRYPKNGIYVIELCVINRCTKFQTNIFIFGCAMAQKPGKGDDVTF